MKKTAKRILTLLMALMLLPAAGVTAAGAEEAGYPEELRVGHTTITKGDFFTEMFGNDT